MKRSSSSGSPLRYAALSSPTRKTACIGRPPRSAWTQPSLVLSSVRAQSPTPFVPRAELGTSSTMPANIFVGNEVVPRELHFIEVPLRVEEERIAAPTHEPT